jgi:hypothetical protein
MGVETGLLDSPVVTHLLITRQLLVRLIPVGKHE